MERKTAAWAGTATAMELAMSQPQTLARRDMVVSPLCRVPEAAKSLSRLPLWYGLHLLKHEIGVLVAAKG
jgi:hypothetical protein